MEKQPYKPGANHPWKHLYKTNLTKIEDEKIAPKQQIKSLKIFLVEIIDSWETLRVDVEDAIDLSSHSFQTMSDKQKAKWLSDLLIRNYFKNLEEDNDATI